MQPHAAVVIPSLSGGWLEIGRPIYPELLELWRRNHGYDPAAELARPLEATDLVSTVVIHAADGTLFGTPVTWPPETQRRFAHFFASIARMTYTFPRHAAFSDGKRLSIDAEAYRAPSKARRPVHVRLDARTTLAPRDVAFEASLVIDQAALSSVVELCCAVFPALGEDDLREARS